MARLLIRDLTPATTYYLQFRADDGTQVSEWSRRFEISTDSDTVAPDVPVWDTPDWEVDGDTFVARWLPIDINLDQNKDFSHYELVLTAASISVTIKTNNIAFVLSFEQNRVFFGTPQATVDAKLRALDTNGNASAYTSIESATNPPPPNVSSVTVQPLYDAIDITWPPVVIDDLVGYRVDVSVTAAGSGYFTVYEGPNPAYVYTTYSYAVDHYVRVYAIDKFGSVSSSPVTSSAVKPKNAFSLDLDPPATPTSVVATASFNTTTNESYIDVSWSAVADTDLAGYIVRYGQVSGQWTYVTLDKSALATRIVVVPGASYYIGVAAKDLSNNISGWGVPTPNPTSSIADTTAPSTPAAPTVVLNTLQAQVTISGDKAAGGAMESDVVYYEVYGSTTTGFTPAASNMLGTIQDGPVRIGTFDIPASSGSGSNQTWYFKIIAVDRAENKSSASAQVSGAVGLIATANIGDLVVTNAKINDLAVSKLTAGTINTGDINVESRFVLGTASSDGVIESYDYGTSGGTAGFSLDSDGLIIKTGAIEAASLRLQDSANIMPNAMADFELDEFFYFDNTVPATPVAKALNWSSVTDMTINIDSAFARFGLRSLKIVQSSATGRTIYLASSSTANNIFFPNDGAIYFVSFWVRPSVTNALTAILANGNTTHTTATVKRSVNDATTLVASTWQQVYLETTAVNLDSGNIRITLPAVAGTWYIDGVQIERKVAGAVKPGAWRSPSVTEIDGGMVKTGSIQSSNTNLEWDSVTSSFVTGSEPAWSIDLEGDATFGNVQVLGNVIVGDSSDVANSDKYVMASAFYQPGTDGWIMHGDGWVEFNQIVANTIDGDSIKAGTLSAEKMSGGSLGADISVIGGGGFSIFGPTGVPGIDSPIIQLNPTTGLLVDPPGDGYINVPSNGDPVEIKNVSLSATDAKFFGNVQIWGSDNYISGDLMLEKAIPDPTNAPSVVSGWSDPSTFMSTTPAAGFGTFGLTEDATGNYWITGLIKPSAKNGQMQKIDKTTGAYSYLVGNMTITRQVTQSGFSPADIVTGPDYLRGVGKIINAGTTYYAALLHYPAQSGTAQLWSTTYHSYINKSYSFPQYWAVHLYAVGNGDPTNPDITWTYTKPANMNLPFLISDGTYFYIGNSSTSSPFNFTISRFAYNGASETVVASSTGGGVNTDISALYVGAAIRTSDSLTDIGGTKYLIAGSQTDIWSLTGVSTTNDTATTFPRAENITQWGLHWDGTQFRGINNSGKIYKYSTSTKTQVSRNITYAWYDADSTGGTHESLQSPIKAYTTLRRGWFKVVTDTPNDNGGTDDPDSVVIYIDDIDNGVYNPSSGVLSHLFGDFLTSGTGPVTGTSEFATLTAPGVLISRETDGTNPYIELSGDGSWRLGDISADTSGVTRATTTTWTSLTLAASVTGYVNYKVVGGTVFIDMSAGFPSTSAGASRTLVAAGGIPTSLRPATIKRTTAVGSTVVVRIDVNTDGSILAIPITAAAVSAVVVTAYPAGA